jgi:16S rRNA processing protein RimM
LPEKRICVGVVLGAHGVRGQVRIRSFTERPEDISAFGPVETGDGAHRFTLKLSRIKGDVGVAWLQGVEDRMAAEALKGSQLFVARSALPELKAEEDAFYLADLIGLPVRWLDADRPEGKVVAMHNFGAGDLVEIEVPARPGAKAENLMLTFDREVVREVNLAEGYITVFPPAVVMGEGKE